MNLYFGSEVSPCHVWMIAGCSLLWRFRLGVVLAGAMRVHAGYLSSGDLVSFSYYCLEVGGAIDKLVACVGAIQAAVGASARVVELLDSPVEFADDAVATM